MDKLNKYMKKKIIKAIYKKVKTIEHLKELIKQGKREYSIVLNGGIKSSKYIGYGQKQKRFYIFNYVDDSEQVLTEKQIMNPKITNIGKAIKLGALIYEI